MVVWHRGRQLRGYSDSGIDGIIRKLKERCESLYDRPFDFSNHTFRRTGGRLMWKTGVPLETIMDMLGHEDTSQTVKYLGLNLDDQEKAMELYVQYQNAVVCPENGVFREEPEGCGGPKEIWVDSDHWPRSKSALSRASRGHALGRSIER